VQCAEKENKLKSIEQIIFLFTRQRSKWTVVWSFSLGCITFFLLRYFRFFFMCYCRGWLQEQQQRDSSHLKQFSPSTPVLQCSSFYEFFRISRAYEGKKREKASLSVLVCAGEKRKSRPDSIGKLQPVDLSALADKKTSPQRNSIKNSNSYLFRFRTTRTPHTRPHYISLCSALGLVACCMRISARLHISPFFRVFLAKSFSLSTTC
jgi:hypothetical protein